MYDATEFGKNEDGKVFNFRGDRLVVDGYATSNYYYTYYILKHYPDFILNNKFQDLGDFVIYPKVHLQISIMQYICVQVSGELKLRERDLKIK